MKLPRYSERSTVGELQSLRNVVQTPQEAAAVQAAKYGAIAAGAQAIGDVVQGIAEIKSEEEYETAKTQYSIVNRQLETAFDDQKVEVDEFGNSSYDADEAMTKIREARAKLEADVFATIKSKSAQRSFAAYIADESESSEIKYMAAVAEKSKQVMEYQQVVDVANLRDAKDYDGAVARSEAALRKGTITSVQYQKQVKDTGILKDSNYIYEELGRPDVSPQDLNDLLDNIANGVHPDGSPMVTDDQKRLYAFRSAVNTRLNMFEENKDEGIKTVERETFNELYRLGLEGDLTLDEYEEKANLVGGFIGAHDKILRDMATGQHTDNISSSDDLTQYRDQLDELKYQAVEDDENWAEKADNLLTSIGESEMSHKDKMAMSKEITGAISELHNDDKYQLMARKVYSDIAGFEEGMVASFNIDGAYNEVVSTAMDARLALLDELDRAGTSKGLKEWWLGVDGQPGQKQFFRAKSQAATLEKVMTQPLVLPIDGKIDEEFRQEVTQSMKDWQETADPDSTPAERAESIDTAIKKFREQTGITITKPIIKTIGE
jgi:hypothetical protein